MLMGALLALPTVHATAFAQSDTTIVLGQVTRDLTGDGRPETLRLVGTGPRFDSLDVTLTITRDLTVIYRRVMTPLTRRIGLDGPTRKRTLAQQRAFLAEYGTWFLDDRKFMTPEGFVDEFQSFAPRHLAAIPGVISRDGGFPGDTARGAALWREMQSRNVTLFAFSPGGDLSLVIGWSEQDGRFYLLKECC